MSAIAEIRGQRDAAVAAGVHPVFLVEDDYRIALLVRAILHASGQRRFP